ncbi:MAG: hypothetical protein ABS52_00755 [Gemmatimonadetes bacterium SCN 70-22]|nr:MAG: hypothetical protein ABS52_00755 [Gemmatimonadetes bacterium SCN 70-22]
MMPMHLRSICLVGAVAVTAACSRSARTAETYPHQMGDAAAAARARADSTRRPYTEADIHFMTGMIGHHAQAIVMARWAESHGASASVRTLAGRIINAQQDEITIMQHWLRDRNLPVPEAKPMPMKMKMGGMEHEMLMPGMLSDEQMRELDAARGAAFDQLFLAYMIQHHKGAITMVDELFAKDGAGQDETVFKFASDVSVDQTTEIARMERMLFMLKIESPAPTPR